MSGLNIAAAIDEISKTIGDRPAVFSADRTLTWTELADRSARLASLLRSAGLERRPEPDAGWESPHDHAALVLLNGNEYLESMIGSWWARAAPVNVNWRYTPGEMAEVLADSRAETIVFHGRFSETVAEALTLAALKPRLLLQVDDESGAELLPGALHYEAALAGSRPSSSDPGWSGADRYIVYTGGTTGRPKGVLWRQDDFAATCLGVDRSTAELATEAMGRRGVRTCLAAPLMHGAAQWNALSALLAGGAVILPKVVDHFNIESTIEACAEHRADALLIVGDAFARPLVEFLEANPAATDRLLLRHLLTGGTTLSPPVRDALLGLLPSTKIVDVLGSSETGRQAVTSSDQASTGGGVTFQAEPNTVIVDTDQMAVIPGTDIGRVGFMAQRGRVPLGYLNDPVKSEATFPVIQGKRMAISGDRALWRQDGSLELLGREAAVINTGGEKVFAEEVEKAMAHLRAVSDCLVVGRHHERFGSEIVAVVSLRHGLTLTLAEAQAEVRSHLAPFKVPRELIVVDRVRRSPSGKPDYRWARDTAEAGIPPA